MDISDFGKIIGMNDKLGIAVIGTGQRGMNRHARTFEEQGAGNVYIAGLCDTNPQNLHMAMERYPAARHVGDDYRAVIDHDDIDVVVVATPNAMHAEQAVFALEKGKHVFCEKPLATSVTDCERILAARDRSGTVLEVGFVLRYAPLFAKTMELIESGAIGRPIHFHWSVCYRGGIHYFRTWHRLKAWSGGLNIEKACHDYDLMNWYFGSLPRRVVMWSGLNKFMPGSKVGVDCTTCQERCEDYDPEMRCGVTESTPDGRIADGSRSTGCYYNSRKDVGDNYVGLIEYASGLRGTFEMSFCSSSPRERTFSIVGTDGEIHGDAEAARLETFKRRPDAAPTAFDLREASRGHHNGGDWRQVKCFLETIRAGRKQSLATGIDGLRAVAIGEAMERSIEQNRPVYLSELMNQVERENENLDTGKKRTISSVGTVQSADAITNKQEKRK